MEFIVKTQKENDEVSKIIKGWGSDILVSRGKAHRAEELDGILAIDNGKIVGLGLYCINKDCEIKLLETFIQNKGIGTQIIGRIKEIAKKNNCKRIWLVTTNSNINAIKFYQKRGFYISNIYIKAMEEARKIKPEIPKIARKNNCKRIWLVTTNSNIDAIKFYQKRGFYISNIYIKAMDEARKIKPEIPKIAENGIEIRDEIEFEMII